MDNGGGDNKSFAFGGKADGFEDFFHHLVERDRSDTMSPLDVSYVSWRLSPLSGTVQAFEGLVDGGENMKSPRIGARNRWRWAMKKCLT